MLLTTTLEGARMELLRVVEMNHCGQAAHRPFGNYPEMAKVLLLRQHGVGKREGDRRRRRMIEREVLASDHAARHIDD